MQTTCACGTDEIFGQRFAAVNNGAAGRHAGGKLAQRRFVHGDQNIGAREHRRSDAIFRQAHVTVRAARAHLGTVGRQPTYFQAFPHAHFGEQLAEQQHALSAESGNLDAEMTEMVLASRNQRFAGGFAFSFNQFLHGLVRGRIGLDDLDFAIAEDFQREVGNHFFRHPLARFDGILAPDRRAGRKNFDEREPGAGTLQFERFAHGTARFHDVLVVRQRDALNVNRSLQRREQLGHVQREAFVDGTASPGRGRRVSARPAWWAPSGRRSCRRSRC